MKGNLMVAAIAAAVAVGVAGATAFVMSRNHAPSVISLKPGQLPIDAKARYVSLDKLIVMLRGSEGSARPRYLVMDLVFSAADAKHEKQVRDQLPVLRATAYRTLAAHTPADVQRMGPTEFAALLRAEYESAYGAVDRVPFDQVLVTKVMMD